MKNIKSIQKFRLAGLCTFLIIGISSISCHRGKTPEQKVERAKEKISSHLELNNQQNLDLDALAVDVLAIYDGMQKQKEADLKLLISTLEPGKKLSAEQIKEIYQVRRKMIDAKLENMSVRIASIVNSLDPEKRAKIQDKLKDRLEDIQDR